FYMLAFSFPINSPGDATKRAAPNLPPNEHAQGAVTFTHIRRLADYVVDRRRPRTIEHNLRLPCLIEGEIERRAESPKLSEVCRPRAVNDVSRGREGAAQEGRDLQRRRNPGADNQPWPLDIAQFHHVPIRREKRFIAEDVEQTLFVDYRVIFADDGYPVRCAQESSSSDLMGKTARKLRLPHNAALVEEVLPTVDSATELGVADFRPGLGANADNIRHKVAMQRAKPRPTCR